MEDSILMQNESCLSSPSCLTSLPHPTSWVTLLLHPTSWFTLLPHLIPFQIVSLGLTIVLFAVSNSSVCLGNTFSSWSNINMKQLIKKKINSQESIREPEKACFIPSCFIIICFRMSYNPKLITVVYCDSSDRDIVKHSFKRWHLKWSFLSEEKKWLPYLDAFSTGTLRQVHSVHLPEIIKCYWII